MSHFGRTIRTARRAYRRFVEECLNQPSPWLELRWQIWLGSNPFREKMQQLIEDDPHDGIASAQALWSRENQDAFKAGVYLLRRAGNIPLKEVAVIAGISEPRISQIQREVESRNASKTLKQLIRYYKVKN
ncbi:MAG: hypothetical protein O6928_01325 [Gammaproteobacteria bacterium]|nr:hypothetical protein [Gammaproteobacteria bacterium]